MPAAFAFAIPSSWRSRRRLVSNSANTPSMSRRHLPAAVLVSIGCSVAWHRQAFESAGVEFIDENGGGPGLRLRKRPRAKPSK
jgi:hypothetical protein